MCGLIDKLRNITEKQNLLTPVIFFIIILGSGFCNIEAFPDYELQSKWYWVFITTSFLGLPYLFIKTKAKYFVTFVDILLILLFFYSLFRTVEAGILLTFLSLSGMFFLVYFFSKQEERAIFNRFAVMVLFISFILALQGIAQYMGILRQKLYFVVVGCFDNPAGYASMLSISTPFILHLTSSSQAKLIRYISWTTYIVIVIIIVLLLSRTGILAIGIVSCLYLFKRYKTAFINNLTWRKCIALSLIASLIIGLYFVKKNSADGRLLIWKCTWEMIKEQPLLGHGYKSFQAKYMLYQAHYFKQNPQSKYTLLADNVKHPFNEFLCITAEFGFIGLALLLSLVFVLAQLSLKKRNEDSFVFISILSVVIVFACFSYPFSYPFTWIVVAFCAGRIAILSQSSLWHFYYAFRMRCCIILFSIVLLTLTLNDMYYKNRWHKVTYRVKSIDTEVLTEYKTLYSVLNKNAFFMYNYAAKLNITTDFRKSQQILAICENQINDYDIQMLKADNYKKQSDFHSAEKCYELAFQMCPSRFMPLYELVEIYDSTDCPKQAYKLACEIVNKPIKIPSPLIMAIKKKMKRKMTELEKRAKLQFTTVE